MKEININIKSKRAFTLIELIVVVVVLALLAAVAVPMISSWVEKAGESERAENARTIELLVKAFMAENGLTVLPNPEDDTPAVYLVHLAMYEEYLVPIMTGQDEGPAKLNTPGTGHYTINQFGKVTARKADPGEEGLVVFEYIGP